jgi:hypothetical protein
VEAKAKFVAASGSIVYVVDSAGRVLMLDTELIPQGATWAVLPALPEVVSEAWEKLRREERAYYPATAEGST